MGVWWDFVVSMCKESFPPKPKWTQNDIPDLSGKVYLVTGGNSGIGLQVVKTLLEHNAAKVYLATRNAEKAKAAIEEVKKETGKEPIFIQLDLADLDSVQKAAEQFLQQETRLDVLYNSGAIMVPPIDKLSAQGYDLQFATNVLGHFYLTKLLLPTLISTAKLDPKGKARVVNISSGAHHLSPINYETLKDGPERRKLRNDALYAQSKYATVVYSKELARRYGDQNITSIALNPGNVNTNLQREVVGLQKSMISWMLHPIVPNGVVTHLWAGLSEEAADYNGKYAIPFARLGEPRKDTQDLEVGKKLWDWLEEQVAGR